MLYLFSVNLKDGNPMEILKDTSWTNNEKAFSMGQSLIQLLKDVGITGAILSVVIGVICYACASHGQANRSAKVKIVVATIILFFIFSGGKWLSLIASVFEKFSS